MDVLSDICRSIRLEGSVFYRSDLCAPWGIVLPSANEPRFHIVLDGALWYQTEKMSEPKRMAAGDVLIIPEGEWHWIADQPGRELTPSAEAGAALQAGAPLFQGDNPTTRLICGLFRFDQALTHPLVSCMTPIIHLLGQESESNRFLIQLANWMFGEFNNGTPGSSILLDRLCEVFFIQALRHMQEFDTDPPKFLSALKDPKIHKVLQQIHSQPEQSWTLNNLASLAAMSRAVFADRFNELIGCPPITYLTRWRMRLALNFLKETMLPVGTIGARVGYSSDATFVRAFQRHFEVSPNEYRKSQLGLQ